jgi:hypothetical protein
MNTNTNIEKVKKYMDLSLLINKKIFNKECDFYTCEHQLKVVQKQFLIVEEALKERQKDHITKSFVDLMYDLYSSSIIMGIELDQEFDKFYGLHRATPSTSLGTKIINKIKDICTCESSMEDDIVDVDIELKEFPPVDNTKKMDT